MLECHKMVLRNKKAQKINLYLHFVKILCGEEILKHSDTTNQKNNYPMGMSSFILFICSTLKMSRFMYLYLYKCEMKYTFLLALGNERHWSRVNLVKRDQCPFISQCKQKNVLYVRHKCYYAFVLVCCDYDTSYIVSVHIQCQASVYTLSLCRGHLWRVRLAKQETLTPPVHLVSPLVCRGPWMSNVVLYCWCHSDSVSVFFVFYIQSLFLCYSDRLPNM